MSPEAQKITLCDITTHQLTLVMRPYCHWVVSGRKKITQVPAAALAVTEPNRLYSRWMVT